MATRESFIAASAFPAKLLHNKVTKNKKIKPIHIQLIPTNACNLNCSFCSCTDRDKKRKLELEQVVKILDTCSKYGTKAITVTGGGEPLMYKDINELIDYADKLGMEIGLVTNGLLLDRLEKHDNITWCRISSSDDRMPAYEKIGRAIKKNPQIDWAFSHVLTNNPNYNVIYSLINFANDYKFSHVRIVSDLLNLENTDINNLEQKVKEVGIDDSRVIYQGRKDSTEGTKECYISLLKPVISPEGIFPCCGAQYAINGEKHDMIDKMKMGDIDDIEKVFNVQKYFDGSVCDVCYYSQYNDALAKIKMKIDHKNFV
ncbi:MAG: radical SAM protein [Candidatus Thorarchaeota archaeon]